MRYDAIKTALELKINLNKLEINNAGLMEHRKPGSTLPMES